MENSKISLPTWLFIPPDGVVPSPPVESREQYLPFKELTWENFERLVVRLVRRENEILDCFLYGKQGQKQDGIDILATSSEKDNLKIFFQCKKVHKFSPSSVKKAVDKFLTGKWAKDAREFVLCTALPLESIKQQEAIISQRERLGEKNIQLTIWDSSISGNLCEKLKNHPDLIDDFFGRPWVEKFNGNEAARNLGDRLNGYEFGKLRNRLFDLYSTLFLQHDPGMYTDTKKSIDYHERYVPADITESSVTTSGNSGFSNQESSSRDNFAKEEPVNNGDKHSPVDVNIAFETRKPVFDWLYDQQNCVVLGEPGYGKSTLLRYLALSILDSDNPNEAPLEPSYYVRLPVWFSFARFSAEIDRKHDISVDDFYKSWLHIYSYDDIYPLFKRAMSNGQILLLVDGLDEFSIEETRREALDRIVAFVNSCNAKVVCTSRPRGYKTLRIPEQWSTSTLTPFSDEKIKLLATRWFGFFESIVQNQTQSNQKKEQLEIRARTFLNAVKSNPKTHDLARNPLLCQALINLFRFSHQLPEARVTAYKQIVELFLSKHPAARAQAGGNTIPIKKLNLRTKDIIEVLIKIAWSLQSHEHSIPLPRSKCEQICADFLEDETYGLGEKPAQARRLAESVIEELVSYYGVLVERAPGELNFVHLSIQEFLAAESIVRYSPDKQLNWLSEIWLNPIWRESLIAWFGILGDRGDKMLLGQAMQRLANLGQSGEWQRIQALELRTELAIADLGIPIVEGRRVIEEAVREVETSPFSELRTELAKSITLGAMDTPIRNECQTAIRQWLPGRNVSKRLSLLESFKEWEPKNDLLVTLQIAIQDEESRCRRMAAEVLASLFSKSQEVFTYLKQLAFYHVRPEVRAAALHGLSSQSKWVATTIEAASKNIQSSNVEIVLIASRIRIQQGLHDQSDLDRIWRLWTSDAVDFWFEDELIELFCIGWPRHSDLRKTFIKDLTNSSHIKDIELPLRYLIRCYPGDNEIAKIIKELFKEFGFHLYAVDKKQFWEDMRIGFRGNNIIVSTLRATIKEYREEFNNIFWHPRSAPALAVIGDEEARDDLLSSYETTNRLIDRYWIASILFIGWKDDTIVHDRVKKWINGPINMATPLSSSRWAKIIIPQKEKRREWLNHLASNLVSSKEIGPIRQLLKEFPNEDTKNLAEIFLENNDIWYYDKLELQELFASKFPEEPRSLEILENALQEIDGPYPGHFAASFQHRSEISSRLRLAAVTVPIDVRIAIASTLHARTFDYDTIFILTPEIMAEENSAVRANCLMAQAKAAKACTEHSEKLKLKLLPELSSTGQFMDVRRRSALAGLLELGCYEEIVNFFVQHSENELSYRLFDCIEKDPVSVSAVIEHWDFLKPLLIDKSLSFSLPVAEIISNGYHFILEQTSEGRDLIKNYLGNETNKWVDSNYYEVFARHKPNSPSLKFKLINLIIATKGNVSSTAARLLVKNFSQIPDIWTELSEKLGTPENAIKFLGVGVIGYLTYGWPDGELATWISSLDSEEYKKWSLRDRLLIAVSMKDRESAEIVVAEMLSEPFRSWKYLTEDTHALIIWAESSDSLQSITQWIYSSNSSLSATAISLAVNTHSKVMPEIDSLLERFNTQFIQSNQVPLDGLDAVNSKQASWVCSAYPALKSLNMLKINRLT